MSEKSYGHSLSDTDLIEIVKVGDCLVQQRSREGLKRCLGEHILPLFGAQSLCWGWIDPEFHPLLIDCVGIPERELEIVQNFLARFEKTEWRRSCSIFATDIDVHRRVLHENIDDFFKRSPDFRKRKSRCAEIKTVMAFCGFEDSGFGVSVHRHGRHDRPWCGRDIRAFELIRPLLTQTIQLVGLGEGATGYKFLAEALADPSVPAFLVTPDLQIVFCNRAFRDRFPLASGGRLPPDLAGSLQKEVAKHENPFSADTSETEVSFLVLQQGVFLLKLCRLQSLGAVDNGRWLARLFSPLEPRSRMYRTMLESGLSRREMEIACLMRFGMEDEKIAARLFISSHTLKTHRKNIFRKLGVHNRASLVVKLG